MRDPVVTHRGGDIQPAGKLSKRQALVKNRSDVVDFQIGPRKKLEKPVPSLVGKSQTRRPVVLEAPLAESFHFVPIPQLEGGVFAHRLVESIASNGLDVLFGRKRFVDQGGQHVQHFGCRQVVGRAHRLDIFKREPTSEHA